MANAKHIPEGRPPELGHFDGPAESWIPHKMSMSAKTHSSEQTQKSGGIHLERCTRSEVNGLMGKGFRNYVTGKVAIKHTGSFQDFCVVDIWTRDSITGTVEQMAEDPYLFRPIPLNVRTWIYHHFFRSGALLPGLSEDTMIRWVLSMYCIDAEIRTAGTWAPIMLYIPMILFLSLAADVTVTVLAILSLVINIFIQSVTNTPELYRYARIATFPFRIATLAVIIIRMGAKGEEENTSPVNSLGFVGALIMCLLEILIGDLGALVAARYLCNYEILRVIPNRIYVCRRHGAAHSQEIFGDVVPVSERITGMGAWQSDFALIADVKGVVMELQPMTKDDWKAMFLEKQMNEEHIHRYLGLDVYSPGAATTDALQWAETHKKDKAKKGPIGFEETLVEDY